MIQDMLAAFEEELRSDLDVLHPNEAVAQVNRLIDEAKKEEAFRDDEEAELYRQTFLQCVARLNAKATAVENQAEIYRWKAMAADAKAKGLRGQVSVYRDIVLGFVAAQRKAIRLEAKKKDRRNEVAQNAQEYNEQRAAELQRELSDIQDQMRDDRDQPEKPVPDAPEKPVPDDEEELELPPLDSTFDLEEGPPPEPVKVAQPRSTPTMGTPHPASIDIKPTRLANPPGVRVAPRGAPVMPPRAPQPKGSASSRLSNRKAR